MAYDYNTLSVNRFQMLEFSYCCCLYVHIYISNTFLNLKSAQNSGSCKKIELVLFYVLKLFYLSWQLNLFKQQNSLLWFFIINLAYWWSGIICFDELHTIMLIFLWYRFQYTLSYKQILVSNPFKPPQQHYCISLSLISVNSHS